MSTRATILIMACLAILGASPAAADGFATDPVLFWNQVALNAVRYDKTAPPLASRDLAIVHSAIYDAVNAVDRQYAPYKVNLVAAPGTSREAAAISAAFTSLSSLFPGQNFEPLKLYSLSLIPDGAGKTNGLALGQTVAQQILAWRATDGWNVPVPYNSSHTTGSWRPTLPNFGNFLLPQWSNVVPFTMTAGDQFRAAPPPAVNSPEYAAAYQEVKDIGSKFSALRTPEQTQIALFWADGPGTQTPPGHWNTIAASVAQGEGNDVVENARLFALLNLTLADAAITAWDMKKYYDYWRPITGIQEGDADGNDQTAGDPGWLPFIDTPTFPSYVSGHSTFSGAAAALLADYFGTDGIPFSTSCDGLPGVMRSFTGFWEAAEEAGKSRIYGGIHWEFDNVAGLEAGADLGHFVFDSCLRPVPVPGSLLLVGTMLLGLWGLQRRRRS